MRALRLARVERDGEQQEAREVGGALAVVQDPVVPGVVEAEIREVPQRRMGVADAVQEPDVRLDVAGTVPVPGADLVLLRVEVRSEEHTSELQSLMRISYAVFCLKKKNTIQTYT